MKIREQHPLTNLDAILHVVAIETIQISVEIWLISIAIQNVLIEIKNIFYFYDHAKNHK